MDYLWYRIAIYQYFHKFPSFPTSFCPQKSPAFSVDSASVTAVTAATAGTGSGLGGRSTTAVRGERSSALRRRPVASLAQRRVDGVVGMEIHIDPGR